MSRMLSKMNLISVAQQLPKEDIEIIQGYVEMIENENNKYKEVIDKAIELLGNYRHYSMPDEKQNSDNEDLVNNAFDILKEAE